MLKTMTSKARVQTVLARGIPDRIPMDYITNAGIDWRLKDHFGLKPDDGEGLLQALHVDFRMVGVAYTGPRIYPEIPGRNVNPVNGIRTRWIEHESGGYWDFCDFRMAEVSDEEIANWKMPAPDDFDYSKMMDACARYPGYGLVVGNPGSGDIINSTGMLRGMELVLIDLATDNPALLTYIDRKVNLDVEILRRMLEAVQGAIDCLWIGEDLGTQIGPMISREMYRQHLRPRHQRLVDLGKMFEIPVMVHSCGSSSWVYDDFIEMGVGVVDTPQPEAKDMAPAYLKQRYGEGLAFHGRFPRRGRWRMGRSRRWCRTGGRRWRS